MTERKGAEHTRIKSLRQERITGDIKNVLNKYGYTVLNMPIYEQYDLLKDTAMDFKDESIIRFLDRNTGKSLVLRPDFTPQVARTAAGFTRDYPLPMRIYYTGSVFRSVALDEGHKSDEYQIGWELIGGEERCGDLEMFLLASQAMDAAGLEDYGIVVGDSAFLSRIMDLAGPYAGKLRKAVADKMAGEILSVAENASEITPQLKKLIRILPLSFGGIEDFDELKKLSAFDEVLSHRIKYIFGLFETLKKTGFDTEKIIFDAAETMGLGYYTGINFKIVHHSSGSSLGGGGRYDDLMAKFGKKNSACGMALRIDELMRFDSCGSSPWEFDFLAAGEENFFKAVELRQKGYSVVFIADKSKAGDFLKTYTFKNVLGVDK